MARLLVLCLVLAGCRAGSELRVMAYNVKHGRGMDGVVDLERAAQVIEAHGPDVVTLQEIDRGAARTKGVDQAAWLGERLGMESRFGAFMAYDGGEYGMAVLSRLPILDSRNVPLASGPEPRTALWVRVRLEEGRELVVVGVHLYGSPDQRLAQARDLLEALEEVAVPVVLAGDFNSEPGSPVMELLGASFVSVDKGEDRLTFDSVEPRVEIDHVLVRPVGTFTRSHLEVLDEPLASDHRPLLLDAVVR